MKTSNSILTGFVVLVFIVPLLTASMLRSKVEKGEYTFVKGELSDSAKQVLRSLGEVTVVDVAGPDPGSMHCILRVAENARFEYTQHRLNDSLTVYTSNDTLFVRHPALASPESVNNFNYFEITIYLPRLDNLILDGAGAFVDSLPNPTGKFNVTLRNGGRVSNE